MFKWCGTISSSGTLNTSSIYEYLSVLLSSLEKRTLVELLVANLSAITSCIILLDDIQIMGLQTLLGLQTQYQYILQGIRAWCDSGKRANSSWVFFSRKNIIRFLEVEYIVIKWCNGFCYYTLPFGGVKSLKQARTFSPGKSKL